MSVVVTQPEWSCPRSIDMAPMRLAGSIEWFDNTSTRGSGGEDGSTTAEVTSIAPVADHAKVHGQQMRSLANAEMRLIGRYHRVCSRLAGGPQCGQLHRPRDPRCGRIHMRKEARTSRALWLRLIRDQRVFAWCLRGQCHVREA
ncbi:hypothetical protein GQR58_029659 [Nymphon striatum]|nr:hypothetical protein GQR58_029659 [Nymphon striatum]